MASVNLTSDEQRRVQTLTDKIDKLLDADRNFFKRRPQRRHRVRLAFKEEVEAAGIVFGHYIGLPADLAVYVAVRKVSDVTRIRMQFIHHRGKDTDSLNEAECAWVFGRHSSLVSDHVAEMEKALGGAP